MSSESVRKQTAPEEGTFDTLQTRIAPLNSSFGYRHARTYPRLTTGDTKASQYLRTTARNLLLARPGADQFHTADTELVGTYGSYFRYGYVRDEQVAMRQPTDTLVRCTRTG